MGSSSPNKRRYHHGGLSEALVQAGIDILTEGGIGQFTLRECARRVGVSHAAPKNHFSTVDHLKSEIGARGFEQMVCELAVAADAAAGQSADSSFIAMGIAYVRFATANPAAYQMMFRDQQGFACTPRFLEAAEAAWDQLEEAVAAVIGLDRPDVEARAAHAFALVHGFASLIIDGRLPPDLATDQVIAQSLESLPDALRGVGTA